jgi:YHS domain-containing protein
VGAGETQARALAVVGAPIAAGVPPENQVCPVMGNEVDPRVFVDYKGRRIAFCCPGCDESFLADPEKYLKKVDAEISAREAK